MRQEDVEEAVKYWRVLRWNPVSFLTTHDDYATRLYHGHIEPSALRDIVVVLRALVGGLARSVVSVVRSGYSRTTASRKGIIRYALVVCVGSPKYESEEQEMQRAVAQSGREVIMLRGRRMSGSAVGSDVANVEAVLTPGDWLKAMRDWLRESWRGFRALRVEEKRKRSLLAASVGAIRQHYIWAAFVERLIQSYGLPDLAITLCPGASMSRTIVDKMRTRGVITGGVRTQATSTNLDHLAINVDVLFCKSENERAGYEEVLGRRAARLESGCILSLPAAYELPSLALPEAYCLLLGTAPVAGESPGASDAFLEKLFQVAARMERPIVFKSHNLGLVRDDRWFAKRAPRVQTVTRVTDVRRNRELIDRAGAVVSAPSTLLYYAILRKKPVVIVETELAASVPDEFVDAPVPRIAWNTKASDLQDGADDLACSAEAALAWFRANYALDRGAEYIVDYLARAGRGVV